MKKYYSIALISFLSMGLVSANDMTIERYAQETEETNAGVEVENIPKIYSQVYANIEDMSDDQFSKTIMESADLLDKYAEKVSDPDQKAEVKAYVEEYKKVASDKKSRKKILKFLGNIGSKAGIGALQGVAAVAGDGANILYNVFTFPKLVLKDLVKVIIFNKKKDDLVKGDLNAMSTSVFAATLINMGFPPRDKDEDYDAQFNGKKLFKVLTNQGINSTLSVGADSILTEGFQDFGGRTVDHFLNTPVRQASKIEKGLDLFNVDVSSAVSTVAIAVGVMHLVADTSCLVSDAHTKKLEDRTKSGAVIEKMCNRMKNQNKVFEKPAAQIAVIIGKPFNKLLHLRANKKVKKEKKQKTDIVEVK